MSTKQYSPSMVQFIDGILHEKGVDGLEPDVLNELRQNLLASLEEMVNKTILDSLSAPQLTEFERLVDSNQMDQLPSFLQKQGVNVQAIVASCMIDFRARYLGA